MEKHKQIKICSIIKKYPKAILKTCCQRKSKHMDSHKNGCYLKLSNKGVEHSTEEMGMVVFDFDKNNSLVGIEFVDGIPFKIKSKNRKI